MMEEDRQAEIIRQFGRIAGEYDENRRRFIPCFDAFYVDTTEFLAHSVPALHAVLDLGAGTGLLSMYWYERFPKARYVLVDVSAEMLAVAKERFSGCPGVAFVEADYSQQLPDGDFDIIMSALSIHHLEVAQKLMLFREIRKRLPAHGMFVNYDQFCGDTPFFSRIYNAWWEHQLEESGLSSEDLARWGERRTLDRECSVEAELRMLKEAGFSAVQCIYAHQKFAVLAAIP